MPRRLSLLVKAYAERMNVGRLKRTRTAAPIHLEALMRRTTRTCKGCGEKFAARVDQIRQGKGKYCSITCTARAGGLAYQAKYPGADIDRLFRNRAKETVRRAIVRGTMSRGDCESCGTGERVHGHHDDYATPLTVRWLCVACHAAHHADERTRRDHVHE